MIKKMFLLVLIASYSSNVAAFSEGWLKNAFKVYYQVKEMFQIKMPACAPLLNASQTQSNATKEDIEAFDWAVYQGDLDKVEQLLDKGVHIDSENRHGQTPLGRAIYQHNENMVEYLIKKRADVNKKNETGYASLTKSVIESGFCFKDKRDQTEINTCKNTMLKIARMILKANADINAKSNDDNFTPLTLAIQYHDADMVDLLLENNADIHIKTNGNINAFDKALTFFEPNNPACEKILRSLINKGADVNQKFPYYLPLGKISSEFVKYDYKNNEPINLGIVDFFIEKGSDVNAKDRWGYSALDETCRNFREIKQPTFQQTAVFAGLVKTLLKAGADCHYNNAEHRDFLLSWTILKQDVESVARLIKNGANVNWNHTPTKSGAKRPLHDACAVKNTEIIAMLLDGGADINSKDNNGKTIYDYAQDDQAIKIVLEKHLEKIKNLSQIDQKPAVTENSQKKSENIAHTETPKNQNKEDAHKKINNNHAIKNIHTDNNNKNDDTRIFIYNDF